MAADPEQAMRLGSPALATLILTLAGTLAGRALIGRAYLARVTRRRPAPPPPGAGLPED